jgi:hypothetical protein
MMIIDFMHNEKSIAPSELEITVAQRDAAGPVESFQDAAALKPSGGQINQDDSPAEEVH